MVRRLFNQISKGVGKVGSTAQKVRRICRYPTEKETTRTLAPAEQQKLIEKYAASLNLPTEIVDIIDDQAFSQYDQTAFGTYDGKGLTGAMLRFSEQLSKLPAGDSRTELTQALDGVVGAPEKDAEIFIAGRTFEQETRMIRNFAMDRKSSYNPLTLKVYLTTIRDTTLKAIEAQYDKELKDLEELFKDRPVPNPLVDPLDEKLKKDLLDAHAKSKEEALKAFTDDTNAYLDKIEKAAKTKLAEIGLMAAHIELNKADEKHLTQLAEMSRQARENDDLYLDSGESEREKALFAERFKDLDFTEVFRHTITGLDIHITKENGTISQVVVNLPNGFNLFYYLNGGNRTKADLRSLAEAIKSTGSEDIILEVNQGQNKEKAEEVARMFYEAALEAGFPPDKITVKVNNETVEVAQLFAGCDTARQVSMLEAQINSEAKQMAENSYVTTTATHHLKKQVQQFHSQKRFDEGSEEEVKNKHNRTYPNPQRGGGIR